MPPFGFCPQTCHFPPFMGDREPDIPIRARPVPSSTRQRRWVFTVNNPTDEHKGKLEEATLVPQFRYLIYQIEKAPITGTEHIQGYIEFNVAMYFRKVVQLLPTGAHVEGARGSCEQNVLYCSKPDTRVAGPFEYGEKSVSGQGKRSDLHGFVETLDQSSSLSEAILSSTANKSVFVKYHRGIEKLAALQKKPLDASGTIGPRKVVVCLWGPTGTGKTHTAHSDLASRHPEEQPFTCPYNSGQWFDGYAGQRGVIFDDFRAEDDNMPVSTFLRITDRYKLSVPVKGGTVDWNPRVIYFTSNRNPVTFYSNSHPNTQAAVQRRFTEVRELTQPWTGSDEEKTVSDHEQIE